MGQKTHPIGFRLGSTRTWSSRWFATKGYAGLLHEDVKIRRFIKSSLYHAGISRIDIERSANRARISIFTARPGIIIGRKGAEVEKLKNEIQMRTAKEVYLNIEEVVHPELDAQLVAENVALQLQKRVAFRRAMKKAVTSALRLGADGIRIACSGRLGGAEIARREWYRDGRGVRHHADAQARQVSQGPARPHAGQGPARIESGLRRFWAQGARAGLGHQPPDRGGPRLPRPQRQARREDLHPHLPGQAGDQEARGDAHGQGQGQPRVLGCRGEAWPDHVRDGGRG